MITGYSAGIVCLSRSIASWQIVSRDGVHRTHSLEDTARGVDIGYVSPMPTICRDVLMGACGDWGVRFSIQLDTGEVTIHEHDVFDFRPFSSGRSAAYSVRGGALRSYDIQTGRELWSITLEPPLKTTTYSTIAPLPDGLLVVTDDCVYRFDAP